MSLRTIFATAAIATALIATSALAGDKSAKSEFIIVQSTTSTKNSGLLDYLLPKFKEKTGIDVRVVAVGTGQAIKNAKNGDGDVLLVHAKPAEEKFVAEGHGVKRLDVMYNDFVIVGPKSDPAGIKSAKNVVEALKKISSGTAPFASRGDDSGTHKAEMRLWQAAGVNVEKASGGWYRSTGSGMGTTLNTGVGMDAYVMTDRATWIAFKNKGDHQIVHEGDERLFNQYGVILVNPEKHAHVKATAGQAFIDWLTGEEGQAEIRAFKVDGQQLFFPNADKSNS